MFQTMGRKCVRILGKGTPLWGQGALVPQQGTVRVSQSQTVEEGRRSKMTEDIEDGSFTASRDSYAQSECNMYCIISNTMYIVCSHRHQKVSCLAVFLFQENKSFGVNYHLHSSSDVREAVSRTLPVLVSSYCRWARLLKQQTSISVYHLPIKENKL